MKNETFSISPDAGKQEGNQSWWENNPMTYDWEGMRSPDEGTKEWFRQLDEEFWTISKVFAHPDYPRCLPFSELVDYEALKGKKVLEIGCGSGAQAAVFANAGVEFTAIDLTERAVEMTRRRFELFDIKNAKVMQADAEKLPFADAEELGSHSPLRAYRPDREGNTAGFETGRQILDNDLSP
ncbi:MAG: methyltransferase domain-containing protein [Victivallaceae bacterium]|nr:methyltransferase domain-containing protein [Victivallaceae bacterium]